MLLLCGSRRSARVFCRPRFLSSQASGSQPEAWVSESTNPWFNLAFEDHLFRTRDPAAPVCFLYRNSPCVVVGRNQNPWKELNASAMVASQLPMVRRRSGGGSVYHDLGNVNYSFHVPREVFDRQTHAQLVCRALNKEPISLVTSHSELADTNRGAYVNARNDICIRVAGSFDTASTSKTKADADEHGFEERKVSGSAYKLVNKRAYHHGTMLLSASLGNLGSALRNNRGDGLVTKGVASVPAPVANLVDVFPDRTPLLTHSTFVQAVVAEFYATYQSDPPPGRSADASAIVVNESFLRNPDMNQGRWQLKENFDELQSWNWVFGQTPEFTHKVSVTQPSQIDFGVAQHRWGTFSLNIHSKNGLVLDAQLQDLDNFGDEGAQRELSDLVTSLQDQRYDELGTPPPWGPLTATAQQRTSSSSSSSSTVADQFYAWLQNVL